MVVVNFYFIHAKWLADREKIINDFKRNIKKFNFQSIEVGNINVIEDYDPVDINSDIIQKHVDYSQLIDPHLAVYNGLIKNLHVNQLSNVLKHFKAYEKISQSIKDDSSDINIILEDDIIYEERVFILMEQLIRKLPVDFDFIFLGLPTNIPSKNKNDIELQNTQDVFRILPYCDSYIINNNTAKKLYEQFMPCKFLGNIQLSFLIDKLKLKSQLVVPNIFMDGSKFGAHVSTLNPNNTLMFNGEYNTLKSVIDKDDISEQDIINTDKLLNTSQIAQHPDFGYLKAKYLTKLKKYEIAKKCYEDTYNIYKNFNTILNHESSFLKDYIRLFKYLQPESESF
jgi:GR25 family glycosyltransferase involved in LPS biosynthesis